MRLVIILLSLLNINYAYLNCYNCRYLYRSNKCFLFIHQNNKIIKKPKHLLYEVIHDNTYADFYTCRNNNSLCGKNATYYNSIY